MEVILTNPKNGPAVATSDFSLSTRRRTLPNCRDEIVTALESLIAEHGYRPFLVREVYERMAALGTSYAELTVYKAMQRMKLPDPRLPGLRLERVDTAGFRLIKTIAS